MSNKLFGTSGIRGPADTLFTKSFCQKLGQVFGSWLVSQGKSGYVAVAMDPRESSPFIKRHIITGLASVAWEILDEGVIPTPALTYFVKQSPAVAGGVMITGSHITADLNGVKLLIDGEEINKRQESEIEELFNNLRVERLALSTPIIKFESTARDLYLDMLQKMAQTPYKFKIALDTANGTQSEIIPELLTRLKIKFTKTGDCDIQSPYFVPRDTETPAAFTELVRQVLLNKADLGVGFDIDGDRIIFIDDLGHYLPGDYSCTLLAQVSDSKSIVTTIGSSSVIDHINKQVYRTPVGSTYIAAKMKEVGATFGFEPNGGAINTEVSYGRDGAVTLVKMLNLITSSGRKLSEIFASLPHYALFRDKTDCPAQYYPQIYSAVKDKYSQAPIDITDGVKVDLGHDEWILFRASGNAPEFRVFAQSPDDKRAAKLGAQGLEFVKSFIHPQSLNHTNQLSQLDSLHILDSIRALPDQCAQVISEISQQPIPSECFLTENIVISGMGGSALGGRVIVGLERQILRIPMTVSTEYHLPNFAGARTLVVISSYSGDTQESLTSLAEAQSRGCQIFIVTSGGKLADLARKFNLPHYIFDPRHNPSGQPRLGLGYNLISILALLSRCQLIQPLKDLHLIPDFLRRRQPITETLMSKLAPQLLDKIPVIIASEHLKGAAHDLKNQLNENAKIFSVYFDLPEANHHLLEGLAFPSSNLHNLAFLFLESPHYHPEVLRRYPITADVVAKHHLPIYHLQAQGASPLQEVMDIIQAGAYLAYYLSQEYGIDPGPIPWVDWFKDQLG